MEEGHFSIPDADADPRMTGLAVSAQDQDQERGAVGADAKEDHCG
jgi:hypothetical protein